MKKISTSHIFIFILLLICASVLIVFSLPFLVLSEDEVINRLLLDTIPRMVTGLAMVAVLFVLGYRRIVLPSFRALPLALLWAIPCLLVVVANFPFASLISGEAVIERHGLIWLVLLKCLSIGLMEEMFFRGLIFTILLEYLRSNRNRVLLSILISSLIFGAWHIVNLFAGGSVGGTLLQIGYSTLIGGMLAVTLLKTENIWLCVILHALFNFGGCIVTDLGHGTFQDMWFWIFTAIAAAICTAHIVITLLKTKTTYVDKIK